MANLTENTTYGNNKTQVPSIANLSNLVKSMQSNTQKDSTNLYKSSLTNQFNPDIASSIFSPKKTVTPQEDLGSFPVNQPILPVDPSVKNQPLPEGYNQFVPPDKYGNWVEPSDKSLIRNWPAAIGGGQYITDPTQPGKLIKSGRAIMDDQINPGARKAVLGNLSPKFYQVDHIVPLWVGGADTLQNLQVLDIPTHEKKTSVQAVPLTLLANGKIDLNEAKKMALTWKDKDNTGIPLPDNKGYLPVEVAERYAAKWQDDLKPKTSKFFGEAFKETMSNFGKKIPFFGEFGKGLVGGASSGIIPGTQASPESGTLGTVGNIAGNIVGTITGLGLLSKGLGATVRGVRALTGARRATTLADEAMKTAGLVTDLGSLTEKTVNAKKRSEMLTKMAKSAGLLSIWGQIGVAGRDATGQEEAELKDYMSQFFTDVAFGGLLGSAGQSLKGYATVGLGTASLSLMEGETIEDSLKNAGLMTALHGMAYKRGLSDPKIKIGNEEAYKMSATTMNKYLGDIVPTVKKGQKVPDVLTLDIPKVDKMRTEYQQKYPNDQRFKDMGPITNEVEAINFMEQASRRELGNLVSKSGGTIPQEQIKKEMIRIVTAKNQLYNQTLPPEARAQKEWADLVSMGEKLKPSIQTEQIRTASNANSNLKKIPLEIPDQIYPNPQKLTFPVGKGGVTGYGEKLDVQAKANIDDFAKNPSKYDGKIYIPKTDMETASIQRGVNFDYIANGKQAPTQVPEHTLRAFVRTVEGEFKPIGYMPQESSFNAKKFNLNTTYKEQIDRFRHTIETAKTPEDVKALFSADKAGIAIDKPTAEIIFNKKNALSDEEIYSLLKPRDVYHKLDSNLNNSSLFKKMDELGIDNLVVDPLKAWEMNGTRPRYNPENPYINVEINEQDWLRSMALKEAKPTNTSNITPEAQAPATNLSKAIEKFVTKQKEVEVQEIVPKTKAPVSSEVPLEKAPKMPVVEAKSPVEGPKVVETTPNLEKVTHTPKFDYLGKDIPIQSTATKDKVNKTVEEFFNDIVHDIEYRKVKPSSPQDLEKIYMNVINSFKRNNPGLPEADFKYAIDNAKSRARYYVQDLVDDMYKGTKVFGTEDTYARIPKKESTNALLKKYKELKGKENDPNTSFRSTDKAEMGEVKSKIEQYVKLSEETKTIRERAKSENRELSQGEQKKIYDLNKKKFTLTQDYLGPKDRGVVLANKFDLKLQEPNESGIRYLELDKKGNPMFSQEYLKAHPGVKGSPMDVWGSFLSNEMKIYKDTLSVQSKEWAKGIQKMKASKKPYAKGFADAIDTALNEKYSIKDAKTGEVKYPWEGSWKLNSVLKNLKPWFTTNNVEGQPISQPFRRTASITAGKNYEDIQKSVAKADAKTREITEKAREARINDMGSDSKKPTLPSGMRVKDLNQLQNVSEDLTPFDIMTNGLLNAETRKKLIERYNGLRNEMKPGNRIETKDSQTGDRIPGTADEMKLVFSQIKKLSANIPDEVKKWKEGGKIKIKNNGEPTFEEGVKDGLRVAGNIFKIKKTPGFVNFDKIKESLLKNPSNPQKGSVSISTAIKTGLGAIGATGLAGLSTGSKTSYEAQPKEKANLSSDKIGDLLMQMESSGGTDKGSADKGEVKWLTGLTNSAIKELKRTGLKASVDINNKADVIDASIKYFNLMKKRHPELTDAEIYTDFYWGGAKGEEQRQKTIKKFESLLD